MMKTIRFLLFTISISAFAGWVIFPAQAENQSRVGLVVQFDDANISTYCISYSGDSISGYDVLQKSGLELAASFDSMGAAVCQIGNTGCSVENCFCQSPPNYWSYWHLSDNHWVYSQQGSSIYQVHDGAIEGWRWSNGNPPTVNYTFDEICKPATETATTTPTGTNTPVPATATLQPTETPEQSGNENTDENDRPHTIHMDSSSPNAVTQSPSWTQPASPTSTSLTPTISATITTQPSTRTILAAYTDTPSITSTQKVKATSLRATRQAKKTQESLQKTLENVSTPTMMASPTEIIQSVASDNRGMFKFIAVLVLLLVIASLGIWALKK